MGCFECQLRRSENRYGERASTIKTVTRLKIVSASFLFPETLPAHHSFYTRSIT